MDAQTEDGLLAAYERLIEVRRLDLAERELGRWLSAHPEDAYAHELMARTLLLQGRGDEALRAAGEAVRLDVDRPHAHAVTAHVLEYLDRYVESERSVREALRLAPRHAPYHALLAVSLLNQGPARTEEALHAADDGLAADAGNAACARMRAEALHRLGRLAEAREAAAFGLKLAPELSDLHTAAGWIELTAGNLEGTREHVREALRTDPMNPVAAYVLRLAGNGPRFCAALTIYAQRWALTLATAGLLYWAELQALVALDRPMGVVLGYAAVTVAALGGTMLWVRLRHPDVLAEMRFPGALTAAEQRDALWTLILAIGIVLLLPVAVLLG